MHRITTALAMTLALALSATPALANKKSDKAPDKSEKVEKPKAEPAAASDDLWFEAPIVAKPIDAKAIETPAAKAKKSRAAKKVEAPRYGLDLGLHNARNKREAPRVEEQAEDMSRKLTQNEIHGVIRQHHHAISFCGRRAAKNGERATQVLLRFEVDSKGNARGVSVTNVDGKPLKSMSTCMARSARGWKFPADTAGGDIEFPLMLNRR